MSDTQDNAHEPIAMHTAAAGSSDSAGGSTPARRPRKRRRYRKTTRTRTQTPKSESTEASSETAGEDAVNPEYEEVQPIAQAPEPEYVESDDEGDSESDGDSTRTESSVPGAAAESGGAGGDAPAPVKKRRHRGGRRHRRRRPGGAAPVGTETAAGVSAEAPVEAVVEKAAKPDSVVPTTPAPQPSPSAPRPSAPKPVQAERPTPQVTVAPKVETAAQLGLKLPGIDAGRAKKAMITFVQEQREIRGRVNAVLELSGEINSITAATISVEALGSGHVTLCFFMDGEPGNQTRRDHARLVASRLGKELEIKDLRPILQTVYAGEATVDPGRRMIRMAVEKQAWLLDIAEMQKAFLIQSLNKTERLLGIGSPSLEDARILSPLADVYQSQVYELAKACSIPAAVVDPTREFVQAAELGMKTQEIDGWLYQMLDVKVSLAKLMELGAEEPKLKKIYQQLKLAAQNKQRVGWDAMTGFYQPRPWNLQGR